MEPGQAIAAIRHAVDALERLERGRYEARVWLSVHREGISVEVVGQDVIAVPFFYCAHRDRAEITRRVFRHLRNVADELGARVIGVGSEGNVSRALWSEIFDEVDYHEYPQPWTQRAVGGAGTEGLRAKFDETVRRARVHNPRRVFIGGSDDLIPIEWWREAWKSDADLIGVRGGAWIVNYGRRADASTLTAWPGTYSWAPDIEFCGGGVVMSRALLDDWNWMPFRDPHCEIGLERRAREEGWKVEAIDGRFWAVKVRGAVLNEAARSLRAGALPADVASRAAWLAMWEALA